MTKIILFIAPTCIVCMFLLPACEEADLYISDSMKIDYPLGQKEVCAKCQGKDGCCCIIDLSDTGQILPTYLNSHDSKCPIYLHKSVPGWMIDDLTRDKNPQFIIIRPNPRKRMYYSTEIDCLLERC